MFELADPVDPHQVELHLVFVKILSRPAGYAPADGTFADPPVARHLHPLDLDPSRGRPPLAFQEFRIFRLADGQPRQFRAFPARGFRAFRHEFGNAGEVPRGQARQHRLDADVRMLELLDLLGPLRDGIGPAQDAPQRLQGFRVHHVGVGTHVHGNDDVRAHGFDDVHGQIVHDAAVHQYPAVDLHRREDPRHGHAGPHGRGQVAMVEHPRRSALQVCRDRPVRDRQPVEIRDPGGAQRHELHQVVELLARRQAGPHLGAFPVQAHFQQIALVLLLAPEVEFAPRGGIAHHLVPVEAFQPGLHLVGGHAAGVKPGDDRAHARAADEVDGNALLLQHLQHADMGQPQRPAPAQHQADFGPGRFFLRGRRFCRRRIGPGRHRPRQKTPHECDRGDLNPVHAAGPPRIASPVAPRRCTRPSIDRLSWCAAP